MIIKICIFMVQTMQSSHHDHVTYIAPAKTQLKINCGCVIHISCDETCHIFSCINDSILQFQKISISTSWRAVRSYEGQGSSRGQKFKKIFLKLNIKGWRGWCMSSQEKNNHPVGVQFGYFLNKIKQLIIISFR